MTRVKCLNSVLQITIASLEAVIFNNKKLSYRRDIVCRRLLRRSRSFRSPISVPIESSSHRFQVITDKKLTRNEIANVNLLYDDIVHALQITIDSCINSARDRRGNVLERRFTKFSEITQ